MSTSQENLYSVYLPVDRLQALARNIELPEHDQGAALFADISGFTRLTDTLQRALGARRGAETLARHLDLVYDALIDEVNTYGGAVIGFSGDAITCWFSDLGPQRFDLEAPPAQPAALRAVTCALAMLEGLRKVELVEVPGMEPVTLALKVAIASGAVRRFVVGDPAIQLIDVVVGQTLQVMAAGEALATRGEVIVDPATHRQLAGSLLGDSLRVGELRQSSAIPGDFAIVQGLAEAARPHPWPAFSSEMLSPDQARPWLLPAIYQRLNNGLGEFLTELRPAVALFQHFSGIDYDLDLQAGQKLDAYLRWVQSVLARYEGNLIQLTIGEKGSFIYAAFGAPNAHENDPWRAVSAALELHNPPPGLGSAAPAPVTAPIQASGESPPSAPAGPMHVHIGLSMGVMRAGAYGARSRRTYGVLGDNVNLAARLMQAGSSPGEILASQNLRQAAAGILGEIFDWLDLPPMQLKGKPEPVPVARLLGRLQGSHEISYTTPLVGRQGELEQIAAFVDPIFAAPGAPGAPAATGGSRFAGVLNVYGETGVGKSRLLHAFRQRLIQTITLQRFQWFECPAEQTLQESLYPFIHLLRRYFEQDAGAGDDENQQRFDQVLEQLLEHLQTPEASFLRRELLRTRSMLAALLGLPVQGTLYEKLEPKLRFENTQLALRSLILAESLQRPLLLHIEDAHWLDPDSLSLLEFLSRGATAYPLAILLTSRCTDTGECMGLNLDARVPQATISLGGLETGSLRQLAEAVLALSDPPDEAAPTEAGDASTPTQQPGPATFLLGSDLAAYLEEKTSGNPLFLEQLVQHLKANRLLRKQKGAWSMTQSALDEVPASINAVLLSWLDRLEGRLAAGVQTASVLGGELELPVLQYMYPSEDGLQRLVEQAVHNQIWAATPDKRLLFRQALLRDVAYEMQPLERLKNLHALAVSAIESLHGHDLEPQYTALAYHAALAQIHPQALRYAHLAGDYAAERFANQQAIQHYLQALQSAAALAPAETLPERQALETALGELLLTTSQHQAAQIHLEKAVELALELGAPEKQARACRFLARLFEQRGDYPQAQAWIERGLQALGQQETGETTELLNARGLIYSRQGEMAAAIQTCQEGLRIAEKSGQTTTLARTYNLLGHIARIQGDSPSAITHFERALALYLQAADLAGQATTHNQVANALFGLGRWGEAGEQFSKARLLFEQLGDSYHRAFTDNNLGWIAANQGRLEEARQYYLNGLITVEQTGASAYVLGSFHTNLGATYTRLGNAELARQCLQTSQDFFQQVGARDWLPEMHRHLADLALLEGDQAAAQEQAEIALRLAEEMKLRGEQASALRTLGEIARSQERFPEAEQRLRQSLDVLDQGGDPFERARAGLALAGVCQILGRQVEMKQLLAQSIPVFERLGAGPELEQARWLFDS